MWGLPCQSILPSRWAASSPGPPASSGPPAVVLTCFEHHPPPLHVLFMRLTQSISALLPLRNEGSNVVEGGTVRVPKDGSAVQTGTGMDLGDVLALNPAPDSVVSSLDLRGSRAGQSVTHWP